MVVDLKKIMFIAMVFLVSFTILQEGVSGLTWSKVDTDTDTDTDTANTTQEMIDAINQTDYYYNIQSQSSVIVFNTSYDAAFGWGDHSIAGYMTNTFNSTYDAYIDTDTANTTAEMIAAINQTDYYYNIQSQSSVIVFNSSYDMAFNWGDHSGAGYVTNTYNATYDAKPDNTYNSSYHTAFGWGDHSGAGYMTDTFNSTYDAKPDSTFNATYDAYTDTDTANTTAEMQSAINTTDYYVFQAKNATDLECTNCIGGTEIDESTLTGYSTFNATYDAFEDTDTANTTAEMISAINQSGYYYNIQSQSSVIVFNSSYDAAFGWGDHGAEGYMTNTFNATYDAYEDTDTANTSAEMIAAINQTDYYYQIVSKDVTCTDCLGGTEIDESSLTGIPTYNATYDAKPDNTYNSTYHTVSVNDPSDFDDITDFTGTLTDTKICTWDDGNSEIDCNTDVAGDGAYNASYEYWTNSSLTETYNATYHEAHGWGDHSLEGYLTSYTETDPLWSANYSALNNSWSSTYNSTYDAKPDNTYNVTYHGLIATDAADWDEIGDVPTITPADGENQKLSTADQIYDWVMGLGFITNTFNSTYDAKPDNTYNSTYDAKPDSTYNVTYHGLIATDAADWDEFGDLPVTTPADGETTKLSTADQIYDWVTGLGYITDTFNATYDAKPDNTYNSTYDAKPDSDTQCDDIACTLDDDTLALTDLSYTGLLNFGNLTTCSDNQIMKMNGASWGCEADATGAGGGGGNTTEEIQAAVNVTEYYDFQAKNATDLECSDCIGGPEIDESTLSGVPTFNSTYDAKPDEYCYTLTCGENAALDNSAWEWSCGGNGETGDDLGVFAWEDVTVTHIGLRCKTGTGTAVINMTVDMAYTDCSVSSDTISDYDTCNLDVDQYEVMLPRTVSDSGHANCVVSWEVCTR